MGYVTPADVDVSDNRDDHLARDSAEPGTDYKTAYGTDLRAPGHGRVIGINRSPDGPAGRRLTFLMDNGEVIDWIHLSEILVGFNDRITPGQTGIALSGASGWGKDWYYGSHLHVTRRARIGLPFRQTLDFEAAIATFSSAGSASSTTTTNNNPEEFPTMFYAVVKGGAWYLVSATPGAAKPFTAVILGSNAVGGQALPVIQFEWDNSLDRLKAVTDGIY